MNRTLLMHVSGNSYPKFPADHHTRRIWEELARGFDEYHVVARSETMRASHTIHKNIHLHLIPGFGRRMWIFFFISWALPYFVIRYKPSHLLAQCPVIGGLAAATCSLIWRIPLFVEIHGAQYFSAVRQGWHGALEHFIYRMFSVFTFRVARTIRSLSPHMTRNLREVYGTRAAAKVVDIPTRVDLKTFGSAKVDYTRNEELRIITVGSFFARKNHLSLIADLHESGIPFKLTLVGAGRLQEDYEKLAASLGIVIEFSGSIQHEKLAQLLKQNDVYIHYSTSEGLPRAILEAMAVGLPVIATDVGFIEGVLKNEINSLVISEPWSFNLQRALAQLLDSEALRRRIGREGRLLIERKFDAECVFKLYRESILAMKNER